MDTEHASMHVREAGFRATKPRLAVVAYLAKAGKPRSIKEIAAALKRSVDQVTVYRIVEAFAKAGLLREVDLRRGHPLYELSDEHDHHHVACVSCGRVEDFTGCGYTEVARKALRQVRGFSSIQSHSLELFGMCTNCAKA